MYKVPEDYRNEEVGFAHLPTSDTIEFTPFSRRYYKQMLLALVAVYLLLIVIWSVFFFVTDLYSSGVSIWWYVGGVVFLILACGINSLWMKKAFDIRGFSVREYDISMRKGLFLRSITTIPYRNIQQVSVSQNLFSRPFKLFHVTIDDGSQGMNALDIPGFSEEEANQLRDYLLSKIS